MLQYKKRIYNYGISVNITHDYQYIAIGGFTWERESEVYTTEVH